MKSINTNIVNIGGMSDLKISIAMTSYNGAKYIEKQLDSIRMQTMQPDEIIIYDDNSTDDTKYIIESYIEKWNFTKWKVVFNEENIGWKKNFHLAIAETEGDIVFFCDQDDVWMLDKIEKMIKCFQTNENIDVLACRLSLIDGDGNRLNDSPSALPFNSKNSGKIILNPITKKFLYTISPGCTMAIRKNMIKEMGNFDRTQQLPHDALYWKIGTLLNKSYVLDEALIEYRIHNNNASKPSEAGKLSIKGKEKRLSEIKTFNQSIKEITKIYQELPAYVKQEDLSIMLNKLDIFCIERKKFLKKEIGIFNFTFFYISYYRNVKMYLGDLLCRIKQRNI